jgi:DNA polymerase-1
MKSNILIIDSLSICHAAKFAMANAKLSYDESSTGIIFGFLREIISLAKTFETNRFVFMWDSKKNLRKELNETYKAKRKDVDEKTKELNTIAYPQFSIIRTHVLPKLGFKHNYIWTGYEADDLIASFCFKFGGINKDEKFTIVSSDEDLYRLLITADMYSIKKKQIYTWDDFRDEFGVTPIDWTEVKAIGGCKSDGVQGLQNYGEKKICNYINKVCTDKQKEEIDAFKKSEDYALNKRLVSIPFDGHTFDGFKEPYFEPKLYLNDFEDICYEYDFKSLLRDEQRIKKVLKLI